MTYVFDYKCGYSKVVVHSEPCTRPTADIEDAICAEHANDVG